MSPQAGWILQEEVVRRLRSSIQSVRQVGAEDPEELIQDATCMAAQMMHRNELRNKQVTPGNIAYYTIQHLKSGRRSSGSSTADVFGTGTQLNGSSRINSLSEPVATDEAGHEIFELHDILSNDHEDPSVQATRKIDWDCFLKGLSELERLLVEFMGQGRTVSEAARSAGLSQSTMRTYRLKIAAKILEFMGADILIEIGRMPGWRINLDVDRELVACKQGRRLLGSA